MEPFVPEPEERISTKNNAGRGRKGKPASGQQGSVAAGAFSLAAVVPALVVGVVLGLMLMVNNSGKNEQIESLGRQLAGLKKQVDDVAAAPPPASRASAPADEVVENAGDRLGKLEKLVASQVGELETMREMVAETLSKLDSDLEGSLVNYYERNRKAIAQLNTDLTALSQGQTGLEALKKDLLALSREVAVGAESRQQLAGGVEKLQSDLAAQQSTLTAALESVEKSAVADRDDIRREITALVARVDTAASQEALEQLAASADDARGRLTAQVKELGEAVQTRVAATQFQEELTPLDAGLTAMDDRLSTLQNQLGAMVSGDSLAQVTSSVSDELAEFKQQLDDVQTGVSRDMEKVSDDLNQQLAAVQQKLAAVDGRLDDKADSGSVAQLQAQLDKELNGLAQRVNDVSAQEGAGVAGQDMQKISADLNQQLAAVQQKLAAVDGQLDDKADSGRVAQLNAELNKELQGLKQQTSALGDKIADRASSQNVERMGASINDELAQLKTQLNSLDTRVKAGASGDALEQLAATVKKDLSTVQAQVSSLEANINASSGELSSQAGRYDELARQVASLSGVAPQSAVPVAVESTLGELKEAQAALASNLQSTQSRLEKLSRDLQTKVAGLSTASATGGAGADVGVLKQQLVSLSGEVNQAKTQLSSYDQAMKALRVDVTNRIAAAEAEMDQLASTVQQQGDAGLQTQVARLQKTFEVLKKQHPYTEFPE